MIQKTAIAMLNQAIVRPYGAIKDLKLDTEARSIEVEAELKGETQPIRIHVREYRIVEEQGTAYLILKGISTSREWLTTLAQNYAAERRFELPESVRPYLSMLA